jgi:hypothetical protein
MSFASLWPGWGKAAKRDLSNLAAHPDAEKHELFLRGDGTLTAVPQSAVTDLGTALDAKQAALVSGTSIKTINGASVLGEGNIEIESSPGGGGGFGGFASTNSSGNTTITVGSTNGHHIEATTVSGSGSTTRIFIFDVETLPVTWAVAYHRCVMPTTAAITLEWRNATSGGTVLTSFLSNDSGDDVVAKFYFDGTAWQFLEFTSPANA